MAEVATRQIEYEIGGESFTGFLAYDASAEEPRPGVLVIHEWWGLNDHARTRARMLAELGYTAFALDMYGEGRTAETVPGAQELAGPFYAGDDRDLMRERSRAGLGVLAAQPETDADRLAAIGYCFGGTAALELARSGAEIDVAVAFHANLSTPVPARPGVVDATVLACIGAADPLAPADQRDDFRDEMEAAGVDYAMIEYGGAVHSFTNPAADRYGIPGVAYQELADRRSWRDMRGAFEEAWGPIAGR